MSKNKKKLGLKEWREENYPHHEGPWYYPTIEDALEELWGQSDKSIDTWEQLFFTGQHTWEAVVKAEEKHEETIHLLRKELEATTQTLDQTIKDLELAHQDIRALLWTLNRIQQGEQ